MPILEEGSNFPNILGLKSFPRQIIRSTTAPIALVGGETPIHLAQKMFGSIIPKGKILSMLRGQVGGGGSQLPPFNAPGIYSVVPQIFAQIKRRPILSRLRGQIGYVGPSIDTSIPARPYERPGTWRPTLDVANLPSVTGIIEGPERTVHPDLSVQI